MISIDQVLDQLADLYLTGPMEGHRCSPGADISKKPGLSAWRAGPKRLPPSPAVAGQETDGDRPKLVDDQNETLLKSLEQAVTSSMDSPLPLAVRYPGDRQMRLLVDRHGRVHLWRGRLVHDIHTDVVNLFTARFWVSENIELIALAQRECLFDLDAAPMLHIFTYSATDPELLGSALGPFTQVHIQSTPEASGSDNTLRA